MCQTLSHVYHHGVYEYPGLHRKADVFATAESSDAIDDEASAGGPARFVAHSRPARIQRIEDRGRANIDRLLELTRLAGSESSLSSDWVVDNVAAPNVSDKETVLSFARMAANAYTFEPHTGDWQDVRSDNMRKQEFTKEKT